jgi:hypothetical protein
MMREKSYQYPVSRDVLFILGAGASAPDGVPLQNEILPHILDSEDPALADSSIARHFRAFMQRWLPLPPDRRAYPSLEETFGFIDVILSQREELSPEYSTAALEQVREWLIKCIHYTVHSKRHEPPMNYRRFWETIARESRNVTVVSLNYDSTLEEAFDPLYPDRSLIDYCIPLINYDAPAGMDTFNWWINPREPFRQWPESDTVPIKILKLHGSLNWKYCRSCRGVLLTPWDTGIDLERGVFLRIEAGSCDNPETRVFEHKCPYCETLFDTLILPPAHIKNLAHPVLAQIINESIREIRAARRIVFVGYSFPEADVHIRGLLARSIRTRDVVVVDPGLSPAAEGRYLGLSPDVRFVRRNFADVVTSGELAELLAPAVG